VSTASPGPGDEEALRAAYEEEIRRVRVDHVVLDSIVTLINLGMRRTGLMPGTESERDPEQVFVAIEAVRSQMPLLDRVAPDQVGPIRDALAQLQIAYVQIGGGPQGSASPAGTPDASAAPQSARTPPSSAAGAAGTPAPEPAAGQPPVANPEEPGPAQRSGRLWVPGQ